MNHYIVDFYEAFTELQKYIASKDYEYIVIDTETDNKSEKLAKLFGIGICFEDKEAFYIPIRRNDRSLVFSPEEEKKIADWIFSQCRSKKVIGHNIIYDVLVLENNWGYDITPFIYSDTILQKHVINEERPFGLKEVAVKYLGPSSDKAQKALYENIEKNGGSTTKDNTEMWRADTEVLGEYCAWDCVLSLRLFHMFEAKIYQEGLYDLFYKDEIMPLYKEVTIPMKRYGFPIDVPYFKELNENITKDINSLEEQIQIAIQSDVGKFINTLFDKDYPIKTSGTFPKIYADLILFQLPLNKNGGITLAKKAIDNLPEPTIEEHKEFLAWLKGTKELDTGLARTIQKKWCLQDTGLKYVFNLKSNDHLSWLFFEHMQFEPLGQTEGGKPKVDDDFIESVKDECLWIKLLIDYKKLNKLKATYIEGILDRQIDGIIYTSMLGFGTTSGRFSSTNPNLQNLPRTKEDGDEDTSPLVLSYVNSIRKGFIAPPDYVLIDADQSALEPRCFASVSGDKNLQNIFFSGEDMYSSIAIRSFNEPTMSPFKKDLNYLGKHRPELRNKVKTYALAVAYGAGAGRIARLLNISKSAAQELIDGYLRAYPGLKNYIDNCHLSAKNTGQVKTQFNRIRHLPRVKFLHSIHGNKLSDYYYVKKNKLESEQYEVKNGCNNSTNFPIQGLAAHIMNRSAIAIMREFRENNINGYLALQVHDQLIAIVHKNNQNLAKQIIQRCMEQTVKIAVPLIAEPKIAYNLKDSH